MSKIPMSSKIEQRIMERIQSESGGKLLQGLLTEGLRKMVTELVEAEVTEFLGRDQPFLAYSESYSTLSS